MASNAYFNNDDGGGEAYRRKVQSVYEDPSFNGSDEIFEEIYTTSPQSLQGEESILQRFGKLDIFQRPLCLVFTDKDMTLRIDESVLHQISRIDVPLSVVGVCGVYRTGKSYLMNRLAREKIGFSLGSTIRSQTKGIWAWCQPHPKVTDQVLLLIDTEGLCDANKSINNEREDNHSLHYDLNVLTERFKNDRDHDLKIFCLTMLMSSCLIYNMKGVIDKDALDRLSIVADITKKVGVSGKKFSTEEENENDIQIISPYFVLCLRDFYYQLVDEKEMTADEYMESCLEDSSEHINMKTNIKTFFPRRKCFVISQPALNKKLTLLETLPERELDFDFKENVEEMIEFIHTVGPKYSDEVTKKSWDGNAFECFLRSYIRELSKGERMEFGNAMENASRYHNSKLVVDICCKYQAALDKLKIPEPSKLKLLDHAMKIMHTLLREFRQKAYPYLVEKFEDKAMESMKKMMDELVTRNSDEVTQTCFDYLYSHHTKMLKDNAAMYDSKEGVNKYEEDINDLLQKYQKKFSSYDSAERCVALQTFRDSIDDHKTKGEHQSNIREEIEKYEEMITEKSIDIEDFMTKEMEKLWIAEILELRAMLDSYKKEAGKSYGFFRRLKFLFTGSLD